MYAGLSECLLHCNVARFGAWFDDARRKLPWAEGSLRSRRYHKDLIVLDYDGDGDSQWMRFWSACRATGHVRRAGKKRLDVVSEYPLQQSNCRRAWPRWSPRSSCRKPLKMSQTQRAVLAMLACEPLGVPDELLERLSPFFNAFLKDRPHCARPLRGRLPW
jgi:hypothetical protein